MLASRTNRWSAGAVLLSVLVLVAAWFLLVGPKRSEASDLQTQAETAQSQAVTLQTQIAQLKAQFGDLQERRDELAAVKKQLPPDAAIPDLVRDLRSFAADAGVSLDTLTPGAPAYYTQPGAAGAASDGLQIVRIPLSFAVTGDYFEASLFLKYLQTRLDRAILVTGIALAEGTSAGATTTTDSTSGGSTATPSPATTAAGSSTTTTDSTKTLTVTAEIFVLPEEETTLADVAAQAAGVAGTTPAASATPAASTGAAQ
jgi:Tfp pilus assembly protein PilO